MEAVGIVYEEWVKIIHVLTTILHRLDNVDFSIVEDVHLTKLKDEIDHFHLEIVFQFFKVIISVINVPILSTKFIILHHIGIQSMQLSLESRW